MKGENIWKLADDEDYQQWKKQTEYGVTPHRATMDMEDRIEGKEVMNKIKDFIVKWNGGKEVSDFEKPITQSDVEHLLLQFWHQKPLG